MFYQQGVTSLPDYVEFKETPPVPLHNIFSAASDDQLHVIDRCLQLDPSKRCTSTEVSACSTVDASKQ